MSGSEGTAASAPTGPAHSISEASPDAHAEGRPGVWAPPSGRPGAVVFGGLVLATCLGLFLAQHLKHSPTTVHSFRVSPAAFAPATGAGPQATRGELTATKPGLAQLSFQTDSSHAVTVAIVNSAGESVATLVRDLAWRPYLRLCLAWNGRRGEGHVSSLPAAAASTATVTGAAVCERSPVIDLPRGSLVASGDYRVSVDIAGAGHPVLSASTFAVVGTPAGDS